MRGDHIIRLAPATPSRPEGAPAPRDDGVTRALVIVDAACEPADLAAALAAQGTDRRTAAFVVAPALGSRTARWTGDEHAYQDATSASTSPSRLSQP